MAGGLFWRFGRWNSDNDKDRLKPTDLRNDLDYEHNARLDADRELLMRIAALEAHLGLVYSPGPTYTEARDD